MLSLRPSLRQLSARSIRGQYLSLSRVQLRRKSTLDDAYQPPDTTDGRSTDPRSSQAKPHRAFYSNFGLPLLKTFLMALFTYQVTYWAWLKLESLETKRSRESEVKSLEDQVRQLVGAKKST